MLGRAISAALLSLLCCVFAASETIESAPFVVRFEPDDRHIATRSVTVLQDALALYAPKLPPGSDPLFVTILSSNEAFEEAFGIDDARNIQGFATGPDTLVMKAPNLLRPGANYDAVLRHELLHVLIARNTDPANMPRWFNEGTAMLISNEIEWSGPTTVAWMYLSGDLIPYTSLHEVFDDPRDEQTFGEAYAQSLSMTRFLYDTLGESGFWSFVIRLREISFNEALRERLAMSPLEFYAQWQDSLRYTAWGSWAVSGFFIFQIAAALTIIAFWRKRRSGRQKLREWALEDAVNDVFNANENASSDNPAERLDEFLDDWEEDEEGRWWH